MKVSDPVPSVAAITIANIGVDSNWDCKRGAPEATGAAAVLVDLAVLTVAMESGDTERGRKVFPGVR